MLALTALSLLLVAAPPAGDPRLELVELQLAGHDAEALERVEAMIEAEPERAESLGLPFLRGHLLDRLGRSREAADAFAEALGSEPRLRPYSRFQLAVEQEELGHPEVAAGLVASAIEPGVPRSLLVDAARLFSRTLSRGGDCRLLGGVGVAGLPDAARRWVELAGAECALRDDDTGEARRRFVDLLSEDAHDEVERLAALHLDRLLARSELDASAPGNPDPDPRLARLLGLAFHQHGEHDRAIRHLGQVVPTSLETLDGETYEAAYTLARSHFRQERFAEAAQWFRWIVPRTRDVERQARARYQESRSYELMGRWRQAFVTFRETYRIDPQGRWAGAAVFSMLRLKCRFGHEDDMLMLFEHLLTDRSWRRTAARAALFLASTDLVRGRTDRAGRWLDQAVRADRRTEREVDYWRGRLAEASDDPAGAVEHYAEVLERDAYHPLAVGAARRLARPALTAAARQRGEALAQTGRPDDLYAAWLLLGDDEEIGSRALERLRRRLAASRSSAPFLAPRRVPSRQWPLWTRSLRRPEEMLLALGIWGAARPVIDEHFPVTDPHLAFTGSDLLAAAGATRAAVRHAEILRKRVPRELPEPLLAPSLRRLLFPLPHRQRIVTSARRFDVDPMLLAALIREESRFDPRALSSASARGLTQFVLGTARRLAAEIGLAPLAAEDLYRPEVSISLGAAYLGELAGLFRGGVEKAVAAYNAGAPQARVWSSYCFSNEPEEYFTKVGFRQTRNYLAKVLSSREHYRELYELEEEGSGDGEEPPASPEPSRRSRTGGSPSG